MEDRNPAGLHAGIRLLLEDAVRAQNAAGAPGDDCVGCLSSVRCGRLGNNHSRQRQRWWHQCAHGVTPKHPPKNAVQLRTPVKPGLERAALGVEGRAVKRRVVHVGGKRNEREVALKILHAAQERSLSTLFIRLQGVGSSAPLSDEP